jgi:hypothetical protein
MYWYFIPIIGGMSQEFEIFEGPPLVNIRPKPAHPGAA